MLVCCGMWNADYASELWGGPFSASRASQGTPHPGTDGSVWWGML